AWANGGSTLVFTPSSSLAWDALYTATVGTAAGDLAGNPLEAPYTWTFRTRPAPPGDIVPPRIVAAIPPADATNVPVDTDVRVYFSEPMDTSTTEGAFSLSGPDGGVTGTVSWLDSGSTLVFLPSTDLRRNGTYTATVGASARDVAGNLLSQPAMWSFRVEPEPAPTSTATQNWKPVIALLFAVLLEIAAIPIAMRMSRRPGAPWARPLLIASVFAAGELATGVVSMGVPALAVPPLIGAGFVLDVVIFAAGMALVLLLGLAKGKAVPPP
ncbi:MAG TPA: Ig-like domain-containing protein, partial [Thermoplasmata archaeon]|nr:Ig-like domain-containing protein [Thermoplasmata archaeon]